MSTTDTKLPLATVHGLYHIAIKTENLAATRKFYTDIIGLREFPRPDFGYPGAWLDCTEPGGLAILHVYAGGAALGAEGEAPAAARAAGLRLVVFFRYSPHWSRVYGGRRGRGGVRLAWRIALEGL